MPPKRPVMALTDLEPALPDPQVTQGPSDAELVIGLMRQHLHHHRSSIRQELLDHFEAAFPRTEDSVTSKTLLLNSFDLRHDERSRSIFEELVKQRRVQCDPSRPSLASDHKFEFLGDGTAIDVNGLVISDVARSPFAAVGSLDELDLAGGAVLGRGASGSVMRAVHRPTGIQYAVKEIALTEETIQHAQAEVSVAWGTSRGANIVASPFLVRSFGVFYRDVRLYIIMELMSCSVHDLVRRHGALSEDLCRAVVYQALHGLRFMHEARAQVHRDFKPQNTLIAPSGVVKLTDFGISSRPLETLQQKQTSTFCGTMTYLSPPRAAGEPYSFEADLWSLGISTIELLLGRPPIVANVYHIIQFIDNPPRLPHDAASAAAADFVAQCLPPRAGEAPTAAGLLMHPWLAGISLESSTATVAAALQN